MYDTIEKKRNYKSNPNQNISKVGSDYFKYIFSRIGKEKFKKRRILGELKIKLN